MLNKTTSRKKIIVAAFCVVFLLLGSAFGGVAIYRRVPQKSDVFLPRPDTIVYHSPSQARELTQEEIDIVYNAFTELLASGPVFRSTELDRAQVSNAHLGPMYDSLLLPRFDFCYQRRQHFVGAPLGEGWIWKNIKYDVMTVAIREKEMHLLRKLGEKEYGMPQEVKGEDGSVEVVEDGTVPCLSFYPGAFERFAEQIAPVLG